MNRQAHTRLGQAIGLLEGVNASEMDPRLIALMSVAAPASSASVQSVERWRLTSRGCRIAAVAALAVALALVVSGRPNAPVAPIAHSAGVRTAGLRALQPAARTQISDAIGAQLPSYLVQRRGANVDLSNAAQHLTATFNAGGVWLRGSWGRLHMYLAGVGSRTNVRALAPVKPATSANRVVYQRPSVSEWYANGPLGIEQEFTVARPSRPQPGGTIELRLAVGGDLRPRMTPNGKGVELTRGPTPVLRYAQLEARDARGVHLASVMRVVRGQILLDVKVRRAAYPLSVDPLIQVAKLVQGVEEGQGSDFGFSVGVSQDGNTAVVGAPQYQPVSGEKFNGAAWVFARSGATWLQQGPHLSGSEGSGFGESAAISPDGNTIVVGGPTASGGSVWTFTRSGGKWSSGVRVSSPVGESARDFGEEVALSSNGEVMFVGAPAFESERGIVWIYTKSGSQWIEQEQSIPSPGPNESLFGVAIALSENGATAIIGAPTHDGRFGSAWVFQRSGSKWLQQGEKLTGSDEEPLVIGELMYGSAFGGSVAISADGNTALVGGPLDHQGEGAIWAFTRSGTVWSQQGAKITAEGELPSFTFGLGGSFGSGLALTPNGNTAIVGAFGDDNGAGAAWIFKRFEGHWTQQPGKLLGSEESEGGGFGTNVAIAEDGRTALIGDGPGQEGSPPVEGGAWVFSLVPPSATTGSASEVGTTYATLAGFVDPEGSEVTECAIEYGPTGSFSSSAPCPQIAGIGTTPEPIAVEVRGLASSTTFDFRVHAVTEGGSSTGATAYFTTSAEVKTPESGPEQKAPEGMVLASGPTPQPLLSLTPVPSKPLVFAHLRVKAAPDHRPNPPNIYKVTGFSSLLRAAGTVVRYHCDPCLIVNHHPFKLHAHTNVPRTHRSLAEGELQSLIAKEPELYAGSVLDIEISQTGYRPALITYHLRPEGKIQLSPVCSGSPGPIAACPQ
jgi:hypothetical protein